MDDDLLRPVRTTYFKNKRAPDAQAPTARAGEASKAVAPGADEALQALRSQPDYDSLMTTLRSLAATAQLHLPSPTSASVVHVLVSEIVPNYWALLREDDDARDDADLLLACLRSVAGLNVLTAHARALIQAAGPGGGAPKRPDVPPNLELFLDVLAAVLAGDDSIRTLWTSSAAGLRDAATKKAQAQQLSALVAGGRILATAAEALAVVGKAGAAAGVRWVADGVDFSRWIGRNLVAWAKAAMSDQDAAFCSDLFQRAMSLGYAGALVGTVIDGLLLARDGQPDAFGRLCLRRPPLAKKVIDMLLDRLSQRYLNSLQLDDAGPDATVAAVAGIIDTVAAGDEARKSHLVNWCTASSGAGLGDGVGIRRAVIAALARDKETVATVLERSLAQFGDQLYITHAPMLQQEVHTQVLILSAGYVARLAPIKLNMLLRSGAYLTAISNRIAATHARARVLGMAVGESLSALADGKATKLDFHMEETETREVEWLKGLGKVPDSVGPFDSLLVSIHDAVSPPAPAVTRLEPKPRADPKAWPRPRPTAAGTPAPRPIIEEIDSSDDDDGLVPYAKGSDPEDSDDDAALVRRNKPKAPVYIRDLIAYLRDSENYDKQKLALQTAPVLIRRKANYGTEVSAHADELAGLLVGLQDKFDLDDFAESRQQAMIALVVAQPKSMGPWFARTFFEGDYSLSQRTSVLVTLGLSARELAGRDTSEHQTAASFPSKRLPDKVEQLYLDASQRPEQPAASRLRALPPTALEDISQSLVSSFLGPLAAQAADATSGPDVLKLQTFTQRYKSRAKVRPRVRAIPNTTAALLAAYFFSPLTAHLQPALRSSKPVVLNPALLSLYLQTVGIVVDAAGPSTLSLPQLTAELWDLLLRVRAHVLGDLGAAKGWLFALTVLIDVNEGDMRRLCQEQGREVMETREWVGAVFERTRGDDGGVENEVKMLAAGVLIKLGEAIEKFQALLMGDLIDFH
ncbi:hypothetical protein CDD83_7826 [Cordyceps sp. RAO-2017]|nr:hypothetical protein CDD83_7826 [Cordyceps sp. RAO-2017]